MCGEFTGHRWIPRTKASDAELWCFLWSAPEWRLSNGLSRHCAHYDVPVMPRECWFPQLPQRQCVACLLFTFSISGCRCFQITTLNQSGNPANQYPVCNYSNNCSAIGWWAFSSSNRCQEWLKCHTVTSKKSKHYAVSVIPAVLPRGYMNFGWRWVTTWKQAVLFFVLLYHKGEQVSLMFQDLGGADQEN